MEGRSKVGVFFGSCFPCISSIYSDDENQEMASPSICNRLQAFIWKNKKNAPDCNEKDKFVEGYDMMVEHFSCSICFEVLINAKVTKCGHHFCSNCLKKWLKRNAGRKCPKCNAKISHSYTDYDVNSFIEGVYKKASKEMQEERKRLISQHGMSFRPQKNQVNPL